jgi:hypothetical protein
MLRKQSIYKIFTRRIAVGVQEAVPVTGAKKTRS